jgi:hypothetical protein
VRRQRGTVPAVRHPSLSEDHPSSTGPIAGSSGAPVFGGRRPTPQRVPPAAASVEGVSSSRDLLAAPRRLNRGLALSPSTTTPRYRRTATARGRPQSLPTLRNPRKPRAAGWANRNRPHCAPLHRIGGSDTSRTRYGRTVNRDIGRGVGGAPHQPGPIIICKLYSIIYYFSMEYCYCMLCIVGWRQMQPDMPTARRCFVFSRVAIFFHSLPESFRV